MKHIQPVAVKTIDVSERAAKACRECQTPCKSACKTSSTVGNQVCETRKKPERFIW
ncbi:MAG: six-cysteine ranthipeptide SCIFF [Candidatus Cryosericum sp.]|nr:six-cysteine ranthipeptide SCIFF [Candidatus Cryosericum sp.]HOV50612.1 six-cysteine ranthipeptide SCIFF [Candidatus Cryosericum sp.]